MARQAFFTLVARLRGSDYVVDFNTWSRMSFRAQWSSDSNSDPALTGRNSNRRLTDMLHIGSMGHASAAPLQEVRADFYFAPCWHNLKRAAADDVHRAGNEYTDVLIFWPAFWHMPGGSCGNAINMSSDGVVAKLTHWRSYASRHPSVRYTVVNMPTLHVSSPRGRSHPYAHASHLIYGCVCMHPTSLSCTCIRPGEQSARPQRTHRSQRRAAP